MKYQETLLHKILEADMVSNRVNSWKVRGEKIVFTNGCFDILHRGHIHNLKAAADLGNRLIVGLNSDKSIKRIKGDSRPIQDEQSRLEIISSLVFVDAVCLFDEDTPERLIKLLVPDILVKGGDWQEDQIVGAEFVKKNGGQVKSIKFIHDISTSKIVEKINN